MPQGFSFSDFRFDLVNGTLWRGEQEVRLSPRAFAILRYFLEHAGQVVSPRELLEAVWPGVRGGMTSLNACMRELQSVLVNETQGASFIEVEQQGYRFTAPLPDSSDESVLERESEASITVKGEEEERPTMRGVGKGLSEHQPTKKNENTSTGFHFDLKGVEPGTVKGNAVQCGALANLSFDYGGLSSATIAKLVAKKLQQLREVNGELGVSVIPRGFSLTDDIWRCTVKFHEGKVEKPAEFHLQAVDKPNPDAGVHVFFDTQGCLLYEFDIPLRVVESVADSMNSSFTHTPLELDLDEIMEEREQQERVAKQRTATLYLWLEGGQLRAQFQNHETQEISPRPALLTTLDRAKLAAQLDHLKAALAPVSEQQIWSLLDDPLARPAQPQLVAAAFSKCLEDVVMVGSWLYQGLSEDSNLAPILNAINDLKDGSKLSIITDCAFLPWEILYPHEFNSQWPAAKKAASFQPEKLWGNRFQIECLLMGNTTWKPPLELHEHARPFVSMNLNPTIDDDFSGSVFRPVQSHRDFCQTLPGGVIHDMRESGEAIKEMLLAADYQATLIYLYCHGQSGRPFSEGQQELLELDKGTQIDPSFLDSRTTFPSGRIVFLNSCSSGAVSPLSFSSFLSRFRKKQALGLIATMYPIPAAFAAAFGQKLIERYLSGIPLGEALLALRRELLAHGNPLGLFYSLQCHMHVTAPTSLVRRSLRHV